MSEFQPIRMVLFPNVEQGILGYMKKTTFVDFQQIADMSMTVGTGEAGGGAIAPQYFFFYLNNILFQKNGLDSRLKAYNKSSPCVSRVSNTKVR